VVVKVTKAEQKYAINLLRPDLSTEAEIMRQLGHRSQPGILFLRNFKYFETYGVNEWRYYLEYW